MSAEVEPNPSPGYEVAPSPHLGSGGPTTRRMMLDVILALCPAIAIACWRFGWYAVVQLGICLLSCLAAETAFLAARGRKADLCDLSAVVTALILALSLPWSAPWYVGLIASVVAIGIGKVVFGGLGQNLFNPAMVGRAFVMVSFPAALGAAAYVRPAAVLQIVTEATPLTVLKQSLASGDLPSLWVLIAGAHNGSLGAVSAGACLLGGCYLCAKRVASWEIPASMIVTAGLTAAVFYYFKPGLTAPPGYHLLSGALLFGAFFIATDPVTSPLTSRGKLIFGAGNGFLVIVIRVLSGYPEGVMFAVLLMNAVVPLLNRWTIPQPLGADQPGAKE